MLGHSSIQIGSYESAAVRTQNVGRGTNSDGFRKPTPLFRNCFRLASARACMFRHNGTIEYRLLSLGVGGRRPIMRIFSLDRVFVSLGVVRGCFRGWMLLPANQCFVGCTGDPCLAGSRDPARHSRERQSFLFGGFSIGVASTRSRRADPADLWIGFFLDHRGPWGVGSQICFGSIGRNWSRADGSLRFVRVTVGCTRRIRVAEARRRANRTVGSAIISFSEPRAGGFLGFGSATNQRPTGARSRRVVLCRALLHCGPG